METSIETSTIRAALGVSRRGQPIVLDFVADAHVVAAGQTGSGKSQVMYSILGQLAGQSAARVVGIDPSEVLLAPFTERGVVEPLIALGSDADGYMRVMDGLYAEFTRRMGLLRQMRLDKFDSFSASFPLMVVVLEEYPAAIRFLSETDKLAARGEPKRLPRFQSIVGRFVSEGRKLGFRVMLLAQRPDADIVGGETRSNLGTKICLRIDDSSGLRMMFPTVASKEQSVVETLPAGTGFFKSPSYSFDKFRSYYVGDYRRYFSHVQSCDPRVLQALRVDRAFRMQSADEFPQYGDPDRADDDW